MDPVSTNSIPNFNFRSNVSLKKTDVPKDDGNVPVDKVVSSEAAETYKNGAGNWFTALLDMRMPTTTKSFPPEERDKVLELIKPGDIILETNDAYPGWQVLEKVAFNSNFTHAAIYEGEGKFLEATTGDPSGKGVVRTDLKEYLEGRIKLQIIRPPYKTPEDREAALNYARGSMGRPYDSAFNQKDDKELYCAELVQRALAAMPNPINVPIANFMGKQAVGPNAFQKIPDAEVVYTTKSSFASSVISHYPVYAAAIGAAAVGAITFGPLGAVGGFALGGFLSHLTGNKIQAGKFGFFI